MKYDNIISNVALELLLPEQLVKKTYKAFWRFVKDTIEPLPLKRDLSEKEFSQLRTNFNIPALGKLHCTYDRYKGVKKLHYRLINLENGKSTENQED